MPETTILRMWLQPALHPGSIAPTAARSTVIATDISYPSLNSLCHQLMHSLEQVHGYLTIGPVVLPAANRMGTELNTWCAPRGDVLKTKQNKTKTGCASCRCPYQTEFPNTGKKKDAEKAKIVAKRQSCFLGAIVHISAEDFWEQVLGINNWLKWWTLEMFGVYKALWSSSSPIM